MEILLLWLQRPHSRCDYFSLKANHLLGILASSSVAPKHIRFLSPAACFILGHTSFPEPKHARCPCTVLGHTGQAGVSSVPVQRDIPTAVPAPSQQTDTAGRKIITNQQKKPQAKNPSWKRQRWEPWVTCPSQCDCTGDRCCLLPSPRSPGGREVASISVIKWIMTPYAVLQPSNK